MLDDKKNTINVISYNQQGGITANSVFLENEQRNLTETLQKDLLNTLSSDTTKVRIDANLGDPEAYQFAEQVKQFLLSKGYTNIEGVNLLVTIPPMQGQIIMSNAERNGFEIKIGTKK
jgi:hypothetical protein